MHVIIIGAGIGGLTTAIALQQAGISFTLYEKSEGLRASGAGISLWPNATRILKKFGVLDSLLAQGQLIERTQIQSDQGRALTQLDLRPFSDCAFCIQRALLQSTLSQQLPTDSIKLGHHLESIDLNSSGVTGRFQNGVQDNADLLIGADGIYSTVRSQFWKTERPQYQGYMAWRSIINQPLQDWPQGLALQYWGQGKRFGLLSMGQERMYWFASLNRLIPDQDLNLTHRKAYLTQQFQDWHPRVKEAIALTAESEILVRPIKVGPKLKEWHHDRVVLMGDSAHAMTPNLGQGACMAIEDAAVLAQVLQQSPSIAAALTAYERMRQPRVNQVVTRSYLLGVLGQWDSRVLVGLRSLGLSLAPDAVTRLSFQTLFR